MTRGPVNVLDANDGQTRVMGCEEQRAAGGVKGGRREARKGVPLRSSQKPWGLSSATHLPWSPHLGVCSAIWKDRLKTQGFEGREKDTHPPPVLRLAICTAQRSGGVGGPGARGQGQQSKWMRRLLQT